MAETDGGAPGEGAAGQTDGPPQLSVAAQYVKDFSFENPNAPHSLAAPKERPQIDVDVDVEASPVAPPSYEATLHISVTARHAETTMFVIDLVYAGLFTLKNIPEENLEAVCLIECPRIIFPFARRIVADATRDGGFPPMLIDPIDFAALYRQRSQGERPADTAAAPSADA